MARLQTNNAFASECADSFTGIDRTGFIGTIAEAYDMTNLRVLSDGSLMRREGIALLAPLGIVPDAIAVDPRESSHVLVAAEGELYLVDLDDGSVTLTATVATPPCTSLFFDLPDLVCLLCGGTLYSVAVDGSVTALEGYVPLIGHGWSSEGGAPHEPRNLLSRRVRIDYVLDTDTSSVYTGVEAASADHLTVDGVSYTGTAVEGKRATLPAVFAAGSEISICLTLSDSECPLLSALMSCSSAYRCGEGDGAVCILYGSPTDPSRLFRLSRVTDEQQEIADTPYGDTSPLYCAEQTLIYDLEGGIRAVCGEADCLLVLGQLETRRLFGDGELLVSGVGGCESEDSIAYFDGYAYIAGECIRRLPLRTGGCQIISQPLDDLLPPSVASRSLLTFNAARRELVVCDPYDSEGVAFIYDPARNCWCKFAGVYAQRFFTAPHTGEVRLCFYKEGGLFSLDASQTTDTATDGSVSLIPISYLSRWSGMGEHDAPKRLRRMKMAMTGGGSVKVTFSDPPGNLLTHTFSSTAGEGLDLHDRAVATGRTYHFRLSLNGEDAAPTRILGFALYATR